MCQTGGPGHLGLDGPDTPNSCRRSRRDSLVVLTSSEPPDSTACPMERFSSCSPAQRQILCLLQAPGHLILQMDLLRALRLLRLTCPTADICGWQHSPVSQEWSQEPARPQETVLLHPPASRVRAKSGGISGAVLVGPQHCTKCKGPSQRPRKTSASCCRSSDCTQPWPVCRRPELVAASQGLTKSCVAFRAWCNAEGPPTRTAPTAVPWSVQSLEAGADHVDLLLNGSICCHYRCQQTQTFAGASGASGGSVSHTNMIICIYRNRSSQAHTPASVQVGTVRACLHLDDALLHAPILRACLLHDELVHLHHAGGMPAMTLP